MTFNVKAARASTYIAGPVRAKHPDLFKYLRAACDEIERLKAENAKLRKVAEAAEAYKALVLKHYHRKEPEYDPFYFDATEVALSNALAALEDET